MEIANLPSKRGVIKIKGKFVYDKYGQKEPHFVYSHFVFNRGLAICDDRSHGNYLNQGRVLNRRYNVNTHEVLLYFLHKIERNGKGT
jgi:hypothetical protein